MALIIKPASSRSEVFRSGDLSVDLPALIVSDKMGAETTASATSFLFQATYKCTNVALSIFQPALPGE
jgi:hypothetical protein